MAPTKETVSKPQVNLKPTIERALDLSKPNISPAKRQMLVKMLDHIAMDVFVEHRHREYWIALLGVESRYDGTAKSPVGALGLGQLLPQYRNDFGKTCGIIEVAEIDVRDDYTNAYLSACYFRYLIETLGNSVPLALTAYNAGPNSHSLKSVNNGGAPVKETSDYVTKIWVKKDKAAGSK
jgi:hypothetical protein